MCYPTGMTLRNHALALLLLLTLFGCAYVTAPTVQHNVDGRVDAMVRAHHCWTGGTQHPAAHHAVVQDEDGKAFYVGNGVTQHLIIDTLEGNSTYGTIVEDGKTSEQTVTVVAFCR